MPDKTFTGGVTLGQLSSLSDGLCSSSCWRRSALPAVLLLQGLSLADGWECVTWNCVRVIETEEILKILLSAGCKIDGLPVGSCGFAELSGGAVCVSGLSGATVSGLIE